MLTKAFAFILFTLSIGINIHLFSTQRATNTALQAVIGDIAEKAVKHDSKLTDLEISKKEVEALTSELNEAKAKLEAAYAEHNVELNKAKAKLTAALLPESTLSEAIEVHVTDPAKNAYKALLKRMRREKQEG